MKKISGILFLLSGFAAAQLTGKTALPALDSCIVNNTPIVSPACSTTWGAADLGAQINAAVAKLPTISYRTVNNGSVNYPYGTIRIANSDVIQTFAKQVGDGVLLSLVTLSCEPGATLQYTGSAASWINVLDPNGINDSPAGGVGGVVDCSFVARSTPTTNQSILSVGNIAHGYRILRDYFQGMISAGDMAVLVKNTNYFTEELDFTGSIFHENLIGIEFSKNCSTSNCTNSFQHARLSFYCQTAFRAVSYCLQIVNGASSFKDTLAIDFNLVGSSNSAVVYVDGMSTFGYNAGAITGENQTGGNGYAITGPGVAAGGAFTNGVHIYCADCNVPIAAVDIPFGFLDTFGSYSPGTVIGSYAASLDQQSWFNSLSCRNITGGTCTTAPTIQVSGGTISQTVVCPRTVGLVTTSGSVSSPQTINPGNSATLSVSSAGSSCTAPKFSVVLQMWGW